MNRQEIRTFAEELGIPCDDESLSKLMLLVSRAAASFYGHGYDYGVESENKVCQKIAEEYGAWNDVAASIANAIRDRRIRYD